MYYMTSLILTLVHTIITCFYKYMIEQGKPRPIGHFIRKLGFSTNRTDQLKTAEKNQKTELHNLKQILILLLSFDKFDLSKKLYGHCAKLQTAA